MKKILFGCLLFAALTRNATAQSYVVDQKGKIVLSMPAKSGKKADSVYCIVDGKTWYKGSRGGIYTINDKGRKIYAKRVKA